MIETCEFIRNVSKVAIYYRQRHLFTSNRISLDTRKALIKNFVWSADLYYGAEAWTIMMTEKAKIEVFEVWCWRRKISWSEKTKNTDVFRRMNGRKSIWKTLRRGRKAWFGHVIRNRRGRPRTPFMKQVMEDTGTGTY